jgi:hypothetical protein
LLIRDISSGEERWHAVNERSEVVLFDRGRLETILQDLWSGLEKPKTWPDP